MLDDNLEARSAQPDPEPLRRGHGAVLAAGTAHRQGNVRLELINILRKCGNEQIRISVDEGGRALLGKDIVGHRRVSTGEVA